MYLKLVSVIGLLRECAFIIINNNNNTAVMNPSIYRRQVIYVLQDSIRNC